MSKGEGTIILKSVTAIIDRDAHTKLPATVFEYELPILELLYGEEQVAVVAEEDVEVQSFSANEAFDALRRKYSPQNLDAVTRIYAGPKALARAAGLDIDDNAGDSGKLTQSSMKKHAPEKKVAGKKVAGKPAGNPELEV